MAHIQLKHVCKRYNNGFEAVKDFDLDIQDNEFTEVSGVDQVRRHQLLLSKLLDN